MTLDAGEPKWKIPYYPLFMRIVFRAGSTFVVFLLLAPAAFAISVTPCPSIGSGIPVATIPPGVGCAEIDKSFSGFIDTVLVGSLGGGAAFGFSASGMAPIGNTMFPVTSQLSVLGAQALTPSYQEAVNYNVVSNTGGSYTGGSYPVPATPGATWAISGRHLSSEHQRQRQRSKCQRFRRILFERSVDGRLSISRLWRD